jgi:hypothetical protein
MSIKRFYAIKDNTITNAFNFSLRTRGTGSNMGASDILEVFSIYGQETTSSAELSRVLIQFPVTGASSIATSRTDGDIPASGSVKFYLRMFNARHSEQLPQNYTLNVLAVSSSWQEGYGLDMEDYTDVTDDKIEGSNWMNKASNPVATWAKVGGDYHTGSSNDKFKYTAAFEEGFEDLELDVTGLVEEWISGDKYNDGFGVFLTASQEAHALEADGSVLLNLEGSKKSFYTKRFFSRSSEFFFKRPVLEARWDSRTLDDRNNFYASSSLLDGPDNLYNLYFYNYVRGQLKNIPHYTSGSLSVKIYPSESDAPKSESNHIGLYTATEDSTGVYKVQVHLDTTSSIVHDVWYKTATPSTQYKTGSLTVKTHAGTLSNDYQEYTTKITNLRPSYSNKETARFRVYARPRNYDYNIYTVASKDIEQVTIPSASYEVIRLVDGQTMLAHSTGSNLYHTYLSYDNSGSYFDFDMSLLESGYMYGLRLAYYTSNGWREQQELFKFRVENN